MIRVSRQVLTIFSVSLFLCLGFSTPRAAAQYDNVNVSYNDFYQDLAPYGMWIEDPQYGYVWSPSNVDDFRPYYTNGYWAMTDYGNTWVSNYSWGWACFHYGRWIYDSYYGWLWIPGSDWGPAWVSWRYGNGYYGWAPLGPNYDFSSGDYSCPNDWWVFIPPEYLYTGNYYRYWYGPHSSAGIIGSTHLENNTYTNNNVTYVSGPRQHDVEQITHQPVPMLHITNSTNLNTRVHDNMIRMFRPAEIRPAAAVNGQKVAPPNVVMAPQPIRSPQAVNAGQTTPPQFRNDVPKNYGHTETPGTNFNQVATPAQPPARNNNNNPYEWDASKQQHNKDSYQKPEQPAQPLQNHSVPQEHTYQPQRPEQPAQQPRPAPAPQRAPAPPPPRESGERK